MKTLIIIRHAKAEPNYGRDKDRLLIERGHKDAAMMARRLLAAGFHIDQLLCSTAARTRETTDHFMKIFSLKNEQVTYTDALYLADPETIADIIQLDAPATADSAAVVGHNPGISGIITMLAPAQFIELPTSGIAVIRLECKAWTDILKVQGKLVFIDSPKH